MVSAEVECHEGRRQQAIDGNDFRRVAVGDRAPHSMRFVPIATLRDEALPNVSLLLKNAKFADTMTADTTLSAGLRYMRVPRRLPMIATAHDRIAAVRLIVAIMRAALVIVQNWRERHRVRRKLAVMTERELMDIRTCWSEISDEVNRPFWQPHRGQR